MPRTTRRSQKKTPLRIRPLSLTDEAIALLEDFASDCTDRTGRAVSVSAVVRALATYASTQVRIVHKLTSLIEAEQQKFLWGKLPAKKPT